MGGTTQKNSEIIKEYGHRIDEIISGKSKNFIKIIWNCVTAVSNDPHVYPVSKWKYIEQISRAYQELCGHSASTCKTLEEFFCPKLKSALRSFFGEQHTHGIIEECSMVMEFPYSHTVYRPSYRSRYASEYVNAFFMVMINTLDFILYGLPLEQCVDIRDVSFSGLDNKIALTLRRRDEKIFDLIEKAVLGDNNTVLMSHMIISAIVKSGDQQSLELLGKLLLAAKSQEGLRQAILETSDSGTIHSHAFFIDLILENDLCRFSSVVRAFDTWSGLGFGDQKQKVAEKCITLAKQFLFDESAIEKGLESKDTTEVYLALWALCCHDIHLATNAACALIDSEEKYRRLVGWYFVTNTNSDSFRHHIATKYLHRRDPEELAWICANLYENKEIIYIGYGMYRDKKPNNTENYVDEFYPASKSERHALFEKVFSIAKFIGNKRTKFEESVFPWCYQELNSHAAFLTLLCLAAYDHDVQLIKKLTDILPVMNSSLRLVYYSILINPDISEQRLQLLEGLSDKSKAVRKEIVSRLNNYTLSAQDISKLTATLTTQIADLRKGIVSLLEKQDEAMIRPSIDALLNAQNNGQLIAGIELFDIFAKKNPQLHVEFREVLNHLVSANTSQDVSILLKQVVKTDETQIEYTAENGYGLYNFSADVFNMSIAKTKRPKVPEMDDETLQKLIVPNEAEVISLYERMADVFYNYRDYEYETENYNGTREKVLLNDNPQRVELLAGTKLLCNGFGNPITDYPLCEQWIEAAGEFAADKTKLVAVLSLWERCNNTKVYHNWFAGLFAGYPIETYNDPLSKKIVRRMGHRSVLHVGKINLILQAILNTKESKLFDFAFSAYVNLIRKVPENRLGDECEMDLNKPQDRYYYSGPNSHVLSAPYLRYFRSTAYHHISNDSQFISYFAEMWAEYLLAGKQEFNGLNNEDMFRAHNLGLITDDAVYLYFTGGDDAQEHMRSITGSYIGSEILNKYPNANQLLETVIDRIVTIEENRGELPTDLTKVAVQINRFNGGAKHFVRLLAALGDNGFQRGYTYFFTTNGELTKKASLCHLLRRCQPTRDDTKEAFCALLKQYKISEKRLIQAAVYAPQWAGLLEKATGIHGLKCGVWFFHAHVNEHFSAEKETEVAIYSAVSPQQFMDGIFDKDWFLEAYHALGVKRFDELYKNAKYITNTGAAHRRSQLYADAVLGRLKKLETELEITNKRNQEKLRAYALIPLDKNDPNDALKRYEFIQNFKKESRQFGSLRQANETKACAIALENLAITTGYGDVDRMTWALEGAKIEQFRPLMTPCVLGDVEVWLEILGDGSATLSVRKNGKLQKTLPKELAKKETVIEIKEAVKQLRNQKQRARQSFESAMLSRVEFTIDEIVGLLNHPVLCKMVSALAFVSGDSLGFPILNEQKLVLNDLNGNMNEVAEETPLIIAHPYDFIVKKCWSQFQQVVYKNKILQPFKQVFREYYPMTQDEVDAVNVSRRYAGNQVQPKKAVSLLKTRGWTVDYEEGLQRVWHKENLIVRLYAMANWFTPADIESPTLEVIEFFKRDSYELVPFAHIPPVIFSETMRDIDLVVSVAHVGGVDPESSHSTVEMRIAIARELLSMLQVNTVSFKAAHALIQGNMGEYSVHMGSGVVHKLGTGMIAVLPVHSQARGRIFLPFADDDPKTAEILSKILLFADDLKIKDENILGQIK